MTAFVKFRNHISQVVILVLAVGCASEPKVRVDKDAHVDFASYKTFAWFEPQAAAKDQPKTDTLVSQRVRSTLIAALQSRGYSLTEAQPDFRVSYVLSVYERPKESGMRLGVGAGGASGNVAGGVGLSVPIGKRTEFVGAMTIDIIDGKRNSQVWTGSYQAIVKSRDISDTETDKLVSTILAKYP
ncbi:MAG TPA: DUF4136 domain-containing protein [Steroidobacteraceae bacterium]|nr:DUF4136 domain-containing protein [Steroidobacteraceae bacterium]